jgi:uncharacterized DUF497 family protein
MQQRLAGFDWSAGNDAKCRKHGVSVAEIEAVLRGTVTILRDDIHSTVAEERLVASGKTKQGRHVFLVFTLRDYDGKTLIRPISARYMHKKDIAHYEKENPGL